MRFLKKIFLNGLFVYLILAVIYLLLSMVYGSSLGPLKALLSHTPLKDVPGMELIATLIIIMILGAVTVLLSSRASSKIPVIGLLIKVSKISHDFSRALSQPDTTAVLIEMAPGVWEPGYTRDKILTVDRATLIKVFCSGTPNFFAGKIRYVCRDKIKILPQGSIKTILKDLASGGLLED